MENTNYQQLYQTLKGKKYFDLSMQQAEVIFSEYAKGNQEAADLLKTGLTSFALKIADHQSSIDLHKMAKSQKYAAALDLLDKLLLPYISSNRSGFNTFYVPRLSGWLKTALLNNKYGQANVDAAQYTDEQIKQMTLQWLQKGAVTGNVPNPNVVRVVNKILPQLPNESQALLRNILSCPTLPRTWAYISGVNTEHFNTKLELALDQAINIVNSSNAQNYFKADAALKHTSYVNSGTYVKTLYTSSTHRTLDSIQFRKQTYGHAFDGINIEELKQKINNPKWSYILDEYMLCKNNLSVDIIEKRTKTASSIIQNIAIAIAQKARFMRNGIDVGQIGSPKYVEMRKEKYGRLLKDVDIDKLKKALNDEMYSYVIDEYMLCKHNLTSYVMCKKLDISSSSLNTCAKIVMQKVESMKKGEEVFLYTSLNAACKRRKYYTNLFKDINIDDLREALNDEKLKIVLDEYMLAKNNLSRIEVIDMLSLTNGSYLKTLQSKILSIYTKMKEYKFAEDSTLSVTTSKATLKSLQSRKQTYGKALEGVDIELLKKKLNNPNSSYIIDEYMLCKHELSSREIACNLTIITSPAQEAQRILKKAALLNVGLNDATSIAKQKAEAKQVILEEEQQNNELS